MLAPLLLFPGLLDPSRAFYYRDILAYWVPQVASFVRAVGEGSWPLWDPHYGFGSPMLADASHQTFYPFKWLNLLLWPAAYYKLLVATHTAFAALGAFRLGRCWGLREWPAFVAAGLWVASGPFLSTVAHHHFVSASWMAWVLVAAERLLEAPGAAAAARLALAASAMLLAGSADVTLMTALLACLRGAAWAAARELPLPPKLRVSRLAALAALLALGVTAAQWMPTLAQMRGSGRAAMSGEARGYWSLAPGAALDLVLPRLIADAPLADAARARWFEGREPFLSCVYLGAAALPLVLLGLTTPGPPRVFLAMGLLLFGALALGRSNPAFGYLAAVPPFSMLRYPVKYLIPFTLCWCLLAGRGIQGWLDPSPRRLPRILACAGAVLVASFAGAAGLQLAHGGAASERVLERLIEPTAEARAQFLDRALRSCASTLAASATAAGLLLLWRRRGQRWPALAAGLLAVADAARVGRTIDPLGPAALLEHVPPLVAPLRRAAEEVRVFSAPADRPWMISQLAFGPRGWDAESRWALGLLELLQPPAGVRFGLYGSYQGDFTGLAPTYAADVRGLMSRNAGAPLGLRLLQLGNVGHVVALGGSRFAALPAAAPPQPSVYREPIRLLAVPQPLPRFYAVGSSRVADEPASLAALAAHGFDPAREVVLAPPAAELRASPEFVGSLRLLRRSANRLELQAELSHDGFAVLVEAWDSGWKAWVDGSPAPVLRANVLFRAVPLRAGRHRLELAYRPAAALWGAALGAAALLATLALARPR